MTVKINYSIKGTQSPSSNTILFADEKFNISNLKKYISNAEFSYVKDLLKSSDLKKIF